MLPRTPKLTCEMAHLELFRRHTARVTSTHLGRLKSGEFDPAYSVTLAQRAAAAAPALAFGDATHAWAPPDWLQQSVAVVKGDASHVLVVVDSVHSWAEAAPTDVDEYTALNDGLAAAPSNRSQSPMSSARDRRTKPRKDERRRSGCVGGLPTFEYGAESVLALNRGKDEGADGCSTVLCSGSTRCRRAGDDRQLDRSIRTYARRP